MLIPGFIFPLYITNAEEEEAITRYLEFFNAHGDNIPTKETSQKRNGYLLPPPVFEKMHCLTLVIEKLAIKNAGTYIDPFLQVSVKGNYLNLIFFSLNICM